MGSDSLQEIRKHILEMAIRGGVIPLPTDLRVVTPTRAITSEEWKWLLGTASSDVPSSYLREHLTQWEYRDFVWTPPPGILKPHPPPLKACDLRLAGEGGWQACFLTSLCPR